MADPRPDPVLPGQESVWSYPRPAVAQPCERRIQIVHRAITIAATRRSVRTLETSHPPSYYIPPADVMMPLLTASDRRSFCEWKGDAVYFHVTIAGVTLRDVAWSYPNPSRDFLGLKDHIAFYAGPFEGCFVDGERVTPQPGAFYGGWISSQVAGPFKGGAGSTFW